MKSREDALTLLHEWVFSESLRRHCLGVAICMKAYAKYYGLSQTEIDDYWIAGLLHDFDYEKYPSLDKHPFEGVKILEKQEYSAEIIRAILGHGNHTGVARESLMARTLFAVDELSGLVIALARVRPGNFEGMNSKSIAKALKRKDFAAAINREDITQGIKELGVDKNKHFEIVIKALHTIKKDLGFF